LDIAKWMPPFLPRSTLKELCEGFRKSHCFQQGFPVDIELVAEKSLALHIIPMNGIRSMIGIDAFLQSDYSGIVVDGEEYMDDRFQNRLRFSIAHEIGHFVMHRNAYGQFRIRTAQDYVRAIQNMTDKAYNALEWQANQFAGNVLVPSEQLAVSVAKVKQVAARKGQTARIEEDPSQMLALFSPQMAREFGVSDRVIERRLQDEGLWP